LDAANRFLRGITITLVGLALAFSSALLAKDTGMRSLPRLPLHVISAVSLLLVGVAFLMLHLKIQPRSKDLLKNLLLAGTFILWGIVQLMPQNVLSMRLGNVVVALFVLDLAWAILVSLSPTQESNLPGACASNGCASSEVTNERA
jgi:hypothetical protein